VQTEKPSSARAIRSLRVAHGYAKSTVMPTDRAPSCSPVPKTPADQARPPRPLSPAAERALAEAAARRAERERNAAEPAREVEGRGGLDPTRYGDWEVDGITSDF
jgi:hypothetical protein